MRCRQRLRAELGVVRRCSTVSMNSIILLLLGASICAAAPPKVVFDNTPERGIPREARAQERDGHESLGTVADILGDSLATIRVRYFNDSWKSQKQVSDYIAGLIIDPSTKTYTRQLWSQDVGEPEIECLLTFKDYTEGRLLLWQTVGCLRDGRGNWWFISPFDYFHRKHPKGDRTLARPPKTSK